MSKLGLLHYSKDNGYKIAREYYQRKHLFAKCGISRITRQHFGNSGVVPWVLLGERFLYLATDKLFIYIHSIFECSRTIYSLFLYLINALANTPYTAKLCHPHLTLADGRIKTRA